jgi:hypothetical protein
MDFAELSHEQARQLIDVQQAFASWRPAVLEMDGLGSMHWQSSKGRRYLYEKRHGVRKSLGAETPALIQKKAAHDSRRGVVRDRVKALTKRLDDMAPVNRALRLGRMPAIAARILRELDREQLLGNHIIVAGTNALYAYETATGTLLGSEHVATTDADLLWDTSQSLLLAATGVGGEGIMGLLQRVDHSFQADYGLNATNRDGYVVDLLCAEGDDIQTIKYQADLEATPMPGVDWLLRAPRFEAVAIGADGWPVRVVVPEPRTFALHKLWVSRRSDRQPPKRPRDKTHSRIVAALVKTYLRQPFTIKDMPWLPKELRAMLKELKALR